MLGPSILTGLVLLTAASSVAADGTSGTTTTTWDCCKPACGWDSNLPSGTTGVVKSCNADNEELSDTSTTNACDGGTAYSCSDFQPIEVNSTFSYGFAGHGNTATATCCQCYEFTWTSGAGEGKSMIVQAVNAGGITDTDFDIYTVSSRIVAPWCGGDDAKEPGGGVGSEEACDSQYGAATTGWGEQYGGVQSDSACDELPCELEDGCHWRWEWAGGTINEWTITYNQVNCPTVLTDISGCYPPSI
ncbi:MAG: hypothetical protein M1834_005010 [Cirrosporium novae-zelandiae]|nr:MAG: hypothetical protein M1834_005010 [Cirrosporium novae-zelandiae]